MATSEEMVTKQCWIYGQAISKCGIAAILATKCPS